MKEYPSIPRASQAPDVEGYCFNKLDGSNIRLEYSCKRGWYKFGTRHRLFDKTDITFGKAIDILKKKYASKLEKLRQEQFPKAEGFIAFFEFLGRLSFAGHHVPDDPKDLILFDINIHKKGIIGPSDFVSLADQYGLHIPELRFQGLLDQEFIEAVREGWYNAEGEEGLVCKWGDGHNLQMMKIKTQEYLRLLKERFGDEDYSKHE